MLETRSDSHLWEFVWNPALEVVDYYKTLTWRAAKG
jgi:hypothetical protein